MKKVFCALLSLHLLLVTTALRPAFAQSEDDIVKNTQNDIMLVGASAAAGAVLGISTLSFVDKPSQHISNIWTGAAFGVIAGVILVAYNSAQKGSEELQASNEFNSFERVAWHFQHSQSANSPASTFGGEIFQLSF